MEKRIMVLTTINDYTMETTVNTFSGFDLLRDFVLMLLPEKEACYLIKNNILYSVRNNSYYLIHYTILDAHV